MFVRPLPFHSTQWRTTTPNVFIFWSNTDTPTLCWTLRRSPSMDISPQYILFFLSSKHIPSTTEGQTSAICPHKCSSKHNLHTTIQRHLRVHNSTLFLVLVTDFIAFEEGFAFAHALTHPTFNCRWMQNTVLHFANQVFPICRGLSLILTNVHDCQYPFEYSHATQVPDNNKLFSWLCTHGFADAKNIKNGQGKTPKDCNPTRHYWGHNSDDIFLYL